ncbi:MAG: hypothetical protein ACRD0W_00610 [Acidimicrobiales bacterium]
MASPHDRAVELIIAQLELMTYRTARELADRLDADHLLGDETTLRHQLAHAQRITEDLAGRLDRAHKRLVAHLDDPDVVAATAQAAMPWHDRLVGDLIRIFDGGGS